MTILRSTGRPAFGFAAALACLAFASLTSGASAQSVRFISTSGNDTNNCSLTAPCRNLQRGINATPAGGELRVLDSGGYGSQGNITKSMTISGQGNTLLMGGDPNILVNDASAVVVLRGLHLNGRNTVSTGIQVGAAAAVHVLDCKVERFTSTGVGLTGNNSEFYVADTISSSNGIHGLAASGIGPTTIAINSSLFANNGNGVLLSLVEAAISNTVSSGNEGWGINVTGGRATIVSTTAANNGDYGFREGASPAGEMTLEFSVARGNDIGIEAWNLARLSNSTITNNATGINNIGTVETRGNNTVAGNTTADVTNPNPPNFVTLPPT